MNRQYNIVSELPDQIVTFLKEPPLADCSTEGALFMSAVEFSILLPKNQPSCSLDLDGSWFGCL